MTTNEQATPSASPAQGAPQAQPAQVDIKQLAERVYRLMLADLRLAPLRGERPVRRKGR